jgi:hypothetical protein
LGVSKPVSIGAVSMLIGPLSIRPLSVVRPKLKLLILH